MGRMENLFAGIKGRNSKDTQAKALEVLHQHKKKVLVVLRTAVNQLHKD